MRSCDSRKVLHLVRSSNGQSGRVLETQSHHPHLRYCKKTRTDQECIDRLQLQAACATK